MLKAGSSLSWVPRFVSVLYHRQFDLSRGNFRGCPAFCYSPASFLGRASSAFPLMWLRFPLPLPLTPLLYHNLGGLSRGFPHFFIERCRPYLWTTFIGGKMFSTLPLTSLVYHITGKMSIVKLYKNADEKLAKLYNILNSLRGLRPRRAEKRGLKNQPSSVSFSKILR